MYSINHFVFAFKEQKEDGSGFNSDEWVWLASLLIEAAKIEPSVIIPQLVCLIVKENMGTHNIVRTLDQEMAKKLFEKRLPEVMELIASSFDHAQFSEREKQMIDFAREAVEDLLKTLKDSTA